MTTQTAIQSASQNKEMEHVGLKPPKLLSENAITVNIGFGFVRGVDTEKRLFYLVTPVPSEEIESVNCLTMGAVTLPTGIIGSQGAELKKNPSCKISKKDSKKRAYQTIKDKKRVNSGNNVPYLLQSNQNTNNPLHATPFSAPWQRYSKPKYQESLPK